MTTVSRLVARALREQFEHLRLMREIEVLQRLVEQEDARHLREDLRDARALALAAGERREALRRESAHAHGIERSARVRPRPPSHSPDHGLACGKRPSST